MSKFLSWTPILSKEVVFIVLYKPGTEKFHNKSFKNEWMNEEYQQ